MGERNYDLPPYFIHTLFLPFTILSVKSIDAPILTRIAPNITITITSRFLSYTPIIHDYMYDKTDLVCFKYDMRKSNGLQVFYILCKPIAFL